MAVEAVSAFPAVDDTRRAFDAVAPIYDRSNRENPILTAMRRRTIAAVAAHARPGFRLLDLGCGSGADAEELARHGWQVTAIDCSPGMADQALRRVRSAGLEHLVQVRTLGIHELDRLSPSTFDLAYSNFGPLNCVPSLADAARLVAGRIRPGGFFVASIIGRICPWEIALYLWRRDWPRLRVRFAHGFVAVPLNGRTVWTHYYTPTESERVFAGAGFERVSLAALGLFAPPPYLVAFAERHPRLIDRLHRLDDTFGRLPVVRAMGDHFLIVLRRTRN